MTTDLTEILEMQAIIQQDLPLEESLSKILNCLDSTIKYQSLGIFLQVPHSDLFRLKIGRNISHTFSKNTIFTMADPLLSELLNFEMINVDKYGFYKMEHDFSNLIISPLYFRKKLFGFIFLDLQSENFGQTDLNNIDFFSSIISMNVKINLLEADISNHEGFFNINTIVNYKAYQTKSNVSLRLMKRYNRDFCVVVINIENYNNIVRTTGIHRMDEIMNEIGTNIMESLRITDIIGITNKSTFAISLPETSKKNSVLTVKRIEKKIDSIIKKNKLIHGWGICERNDKDDNSNIINMIRKSEKAAFEAVRQGIAINVI